MASSNVTKALLNDVFLDIASIVDILTIIVDSDTDLRGDETVESATSEVIMKEPLSSVCRPPSEPLMRTVDNNPETRTAAAGDENGSRGDDEIAAHDVLPAKVVEVRNGFGELVGLREPDATPLQRAPRRRRFTAAVWRNVARVALAACCIRCE